MAPDFRYLQKLALKCLNWPFFHISQCFLQKSSQILPPPPPPEEDHGSKIKVAGLLGHGFLEKIQNGGRRFAPLTLVSRVKMVIQQFYWLFTFCGFN